MAIDYYQTPEQQELAFQRYNKKTFSNLLDIFTKVNLHWGGETVFRFMEDVDDKISFLFIAGDELLTMYLAPYSLQEKDVADMIFSEWIKGNTCTVKDALNFILSTTIKKEDKKKEKLLNSYHPDDVDYDLTDDGTGKKYDSGKPMAGTLTDVFSRALMAVGACIEYGTHKYPDPKNWQLVDNGIKRYRDAMVRHLLKYNAGIDKDEETKLPHLAHMAWNALAILELYMQEHKDELDKEIFK